MDHSKYRTIDGNEAVASIAYRLSEVIALYPITPSSPMGEHADDWSSLQRPNLWGTVPQIIEMQSEAGAAGAVHGALQAGALATTFTASQGLLLMLPNLFKIAGELTPFCMHVAARSVATHALSIFGDHTDVMMARGTGFALLSSASVQEAQDFAAIAHATTLATRIPVLHFFDGFRTSHEIAKIQILEDASLRDLIDPRWIHAHRERRLSPDRPVLRGTSQNPDTFFQAREAINPIYDRFPVHLERVMSRFAELTGRQYGLFEYHGHAEAEQVIVLMGSGGECVHETIDWLLERGEKVGVLKVHLFRPWSSDHFLKALPRTVKALAVLDRTKEPGSVGEPLLLEVSGALLEAYTKGSLPCMPKVLGGRYGLSSREFTPAMVRAIYQEMSKATPRTRFTVGICDDVTQLSLDVDDSLDIESSDVVRALFFGLGSDGTVSSNKASIKIIGEETEWFAQGHFVYDSKKSGSTTTSHLRFGPRPIRSTYQISSADFIAIHDPKILLRLDVLGRARQGATILLNTSTPRDRIWEEFPREVQQSLIERQCRLFAIDAYRVAESSGLGRRINTVMQVCFFSLARVLPEEEAIRQIKKSIENTWSKRGEEIVKRNQDAVDASLAELHEIALPQQVTSSLTRLPGVPDHAPDFVQRVTRLIIEGHGDRLPVSAFPIDGTWPTGTSRYEKRAIALEIPIWESDLCIQCNRCVMICPHAAIRAKVFTPEARSCLPESFPAVDAKCQKTSMD